MPDKVTVDGLVAKQAELQAAYDEAHVISQDAKAECEKAAAELVEFNNKYGRVLQMMREDE